MDNEIQELRKLLPTEATRNDVLVLIQKLRQNLLKYTNTDEGDYDQYKKGKLEFGNIKRYSNNIFDIIHEFLIDRDINVTETELELLSEKITNFTMNQNII